MDQLAQAAETAAIANSILRTPAELNAPEDIEQGTTAVSFADILGTTGRRGRRLSPTQRLAVESFLVENGNKWSELSGIRQLGLAVVTHHHVSAFHI